MRKLQTQKNISKGQCPVLTNNLYSDFVIHPQVFDSFTNSIILLVDIFSEKIAPSCNYIYKLPIINTVYHKCFRLRKMERNIFYVTLRAIKSKSSHTFLIIALHSVTEPKSCPIYWTAFLRIQIKCYYLSVDVRSNKKSKEIPVHLETAVLYECIPSHAIV